MHRRWPYGLAILIACATSASAIVRRHEKPDSAYIVDAAHYPASAKVLGTSEGILIAPQWVLTAAHVVEGVDPFSNWRVTFAGKEVAVDKIVLHPRRKKGEVNPDFDLALLKLAEPVAGIVPLPLYRWDDEALQVATLIGRGGTKTGLRTESGYCDDGRMRRATSRIKAALEHAIFFTFDAPPDGTDLQGSAGPRDSGGPALLVRDGTTYLAGVGSMASPPGSVSGVYGTLDGYARVSTHREWIESTIAADPPSTLPRWSEQRTISSGASFPQTAAGRLAGAFFSAYGNRRRLISFMRAHGRADSQASPEERADYWMTQAADWGRISPQYFRTLNTRDIAVAARAAKSGDWVGFWFTADRSDSEHLSGLVTGGLPPPGASSVSPTESCNGAQPPAPIDHP